MKQISVVAGHRSPDHVKPQSRDEEDLKNIALVDSVKREGEESDTGSEGKSPQPVHTPPLVENLTINPSIHVVRPIPTIGNPNLVTTRATLINKVLIDYK